MASAVTSDTDKKKLPVDHDHQVKQPIDEKIHHVTDKRMNNNALKAQFISPSGELFDKLLAGLKEKLADGRGECIYHLGISDDGEPGLSDNDMLASKATLKSMAELCDADLQLLQEKNFTGGITAKFLIRYRAKEREFLEVRVAVVGNVDAGKSTLLGVLTHGELDNGRGLARQKLFRHKHEIESGRTSSVGNDILGFNSCGEVVNKPDARGLALDWQRICYASSKIITFIDLAGHEKYLKTTIFGMTGHAPDFCMLIIGANAGIIGMTKEHLGLALALNVPVYVVITKTDMCPQNVLSDTLKLLAKILKSPGCRKIPVFITKEDDITVAATNFVSERICPIFQVSNVTGANLNLLKKFLNLLPSRMSCKGDEPPEFLIDETYSVPGVGTVISGTIMQGIIRVNDTLLLGPDSLGQFQPVVIKGIHRKRMAVECVEGGQTCSFALKKVKRSTIRKGMILASRDLKPEACSEFEADILVLHHPTTIKINYQAVVHSGSMRQTASIIEMNKEHIRTGDRALIKFRFHKSPEYLKANTKLIFREGRTKAIGTITKVFPIKQAPAQSKQIQSKSSNRPS